MESIQQNGRPENPIPAVSKIDRLQQRALRLQQQAQQAIAQFMQQQQARQRQPLPPELNAQSLAQRGRQRPQRKMPPDQSRNAGMGGMPPSATGLIPAQGPGQMPVPAENFEPGMQEGEQVMM